MEEDDGEFRMEHMKKFMNPPEPKFNEQLNYAYKSIQGQASKFDVFQFETLVREIVTQHVALIQKHAANDRRLMF